jgi:hypothetical protein
MNRSSVDKCDCTISRGNFCVKCGKQTLAVHDRPCGECKHIREDIAGGHYCRKELMRVLPSMKVTYSLRGGDKGLCFEEKTNV